MAVKITIKKDTPAYDVAKKYREEKEDFKKAVKEGKVDEYTKNKSKQTTVESV